jgi:hypothetical protein
LLAGNKPTKAESLEIRFTGKCDVMRVQNLNGRDVDYWEIIADNLHDAGWSLGWVSALDVEGRTPWIVDAHGYGKHVIVRADETLTAFVELESSIRAQTNLS